MRAAWFIAVGVAAAFVLMRRVLVMTKDKGQKLYIAKPYVNSFHYLAQDADCFRGLAAKGHGFEQVRFCRTAVLLYVFSLEAELTDKAIRSQA